MKVIEKSRRIGISWADASDAALTAASVNGYDTWYIGYNKDMAEQYIQDCAFWAKSYHLFAATIEEFALKDDEKDILAFRIRFASGHKVTALSSRPTNLRAKKGRIVIDEAAFHNDLPELLKAAIAIKMWGGKVAIISTHNGADNPFNELIKQIKLGGCDYSHHRITLEDAIADGLYQRICLTLGIPWTLEGEFAWKAQLYKDYGIAASEELDCVPGAKSGGIIKLESFKRYRIAPHQFDLIVQSWDTAQKAKQKNDPWDCTTWGVLGNLAYLLDDYNQRMEFPEGLKAIKNNAQKWKPNAILIEDKSSGSSAIQQLRQDQFPFSIIPIMPTSDKETRASAESTAIEAGRVYLPEVASWLIDYEMEVSKFPFAQHDDRVDSTSQFLAWMRSRTINISADFGVVENARALLHPRKKY